MNSREKTLLMVINHPDWFFTHRRPIAVGAHEAGYRVHIATSPSKKFDVADTNYTYHPIVFFRGFAGVVSELRSLWSIFKLVQTLRPDIIHLVTLKPVVYGALVGLFFPRIRLVHAVAGLGSNIQQSTAASIKHALFRAVLGFALRFRKPAVIVQNKEDRAFITDHLGVTSSQLSLIPGSGVDLKNFTVRPEPEKISTLMACRLLKPKGIDEYVEAARLLKQRGIAVTLKIAGLPDPHNSSSISEDEFVALQHGDDVDILGHVDDMATEVANTSMIVLPSYYGEGIPKFLLEALASGRPVITTDHPGCRDAVVDGTTGILVPTRDSVALADAIERLATHASERQRMGVEARQFAEAEFDVQSVVRRHLTIYNARLEENQARGH